MELLAAGLDVAIEFPLGTVVGRHERREFELERPADRFRRAAGMTADEHATRGAAADREARPLVVVRGTASLPVVTTPPRRATRGLFETGQKQLQFAAHGRSSQRVDGRRVDGRR